MYGDFDVVIGLEIHAQLQTRSKCFSSASTDFAKGDNENVTPLCAGMPGTLPVLNAKAVELAIQTGLALNCEVQQRSVFARKQYFYPDMPKGYQISQYEEPICQKGFVDFYVDGEKRRIHLERAHMEEDAGKSIHQGEHSLINLNRAGIPLLEIVSAPEIKSPKEAAAYAKAVRQILRFVDVCDGNLEEGSLRCDCNVSIRKKGETRLGTKVELKNINSFRFIEKALEYEIHRQIHAVEAGEKIVQETRLYDSTKNKTFSMRKKEDAQDYRYFPDPDLLPLLIEDDTIENLRQSLPELPMQRMERFQNNYALGLDDAELLTSEKELADFFEKVASESGNPKASANWIMGDFLREFNESKSSFQNLPIKEKQLAQLIQLVDSKTLSGKMAKDVFIEMWKSGKDPQVLVKDLGLSQITDEGAILKMVQDIIGANASKVAEYKAGKDKLFGFFVGQVMKASKGQANPELVNKLIKEELSK
ncbi:MAG: Asp-tRNA(Asn)/Glu-tRNA(Gln) amidotransferase subunit GatB [Bdellovibrionales bacterium]|nr:Asp-tRNA(Asn)/Glu-tRNA(Gln) amidotransferase subunit GatB [Bdellovibrionales bacterium]